MSTKIKIETLRKYIKELIKQELDEASVTGAIDGGEGPPKTPFAFKKKKKKDESISEAKFHVRTDFGSVLVDASSEGEARMIVAKGLKPDGTVDDDDPCTMTLTSKGAFTDC